MAPLQTYLISNSFIATFLPIETLMNHYCKVPVRIFKDSQRSLKILFQFLHGFIDLVTTAFTVQQTLLIVESQAKLKAHL